MERFKRFLGYYKPYKNLIILDLLCALIASLTVLAYPVLVRMITRDVLVLERTLAIDLLVKIGLVFVFLAVIEYVCNYFMAYIGHISGVKMEFDMRNDLFNHFQKLSFTYFDNAKTGQLMSRITTDLFDITELAHHGPEDIIISLIKIIGSFIILLNVNVTLTLIVFAILPLMLVFSIYYNKKMKAAFKQNRQAIAEINSQIEDSISGIRVVKSFANEDIEMGKFRAGNLRFVDCKKNSYKYMARFHSGLSGFVTFINASVVVFGGLLILNDVLILGDLITFLLYINLLIEPIRKLINFTEVFQNGATGFERFMEIMEIEPDIEDSKDAVNIYDVKGKVEFSNVSFKYNSDTEDIFTNLNLTAQAGDYVAIVGQSGVGKTTLCSLIPRFYDATNGQITIDGKDISKIKLKSLRENIGVVQQDVYLFAGTIMDNIRYGKENATDEEIFKAAVNANAHDFIMKMPDGYNTNVGQRGIKLSGGQKQRLSIARVFLKNPAILIFDEATSALDNESEKIVQDSFESLAKNRTTFVIAHRLSTIKKAKRIVVLSENGIIEDDNHENLLKKNGTYADLYNMQFLN